MMRTLIIAVTLIGLSAVGGAIIVGLSRFDGTVTDHPYEEGLLWDRTWKRIAELGWKVRIENGVLSMGENEIIISVTDRKKRPFDAKGITILRSRPSSADFDTYITPAEVKRGEYRAAVDFPLYGEWDIKVLTPQNGGGVVYEERVFVKKGGRNDE